MKVSRDDIISHQKVLIRADEVVIAYLEDSNINYDDYFVEYTSIYNDKITIYFMWIELQRYDYLEEKEFYGNVTLDIEEFCKVEYYESK